MPYIWIGFAVVMAVCEAATAQLVSVWFVIGAICAAIATIFTGSLIIQSLIFLTVSLVALIVTKPIKVMGEIWSARSDFAPIRKGTKIKVLAIEGVKLLVEQAQ